MSKKPDKAVALQYNEKTAPTVTAKGEGELAEKIIAIAKEHDILIHEDPELSNFLSHLELGEEIPRELYVVIAELIAFAYLLQGKFPEHWHNIHQRVDHRHRALALQRRHRHRPRLRHPAERPRHPARGPDADP